MVTELLLAVNCRNQNLHARDEGQNDSVCNKCNKFIHFWILWHTLISVTSFYNLIPYCKSRKHIHEVVNFATIPCASNRSKHVRDQPQVFSFKFLWIQSAWAWPGLLWQCHGSKVMTLNTLRIFFLSDCAIHSKNIYGAFGKNLAVQ